MIKLEKKTYYIDLTDADDAMREFIFKVLKDSNKFTKSGICAHCDSYQHILDKGYNGITAYVLHVEREVASVTTLSYESFNGLTTITFRDILTESEKKDLLKIIFDDE